MSPTAMPNPLVALLGLEEHARLAGKPAELGFVMVNDTRTLVDYRQAALFIHGDGLAAVSGVSAVEAGAPFTLWMQRVFPRMEVDQPRIAGPEALAGPDGEEWHDWLPPHAAWLPLCGPDGRRFGTLLFARDEPWLDAELTLLVRAAAMFGFAWALMHKPKRLHHWRQRIQAIPRWRLATAAVAVAILVMPVRLSVLAPADIVPHDPAVIRSPMEGVIERILIRPNEIVAADQPLFELDRTTISGRLEVAAKALATAQAELDQATQQGFFDPKAKAQVAVVKTRVDEKLAEAAQLRDLMQRSVVRSPRDGVVVMEDPSEWIGRPVTVGEKVLAVANPADVEIEAWLAPADVIALPPDNPVAVFLNTDPLAPVAAELSYVAYEATLQPDGVLGYRVRARLAAGQPVPRLGLKGTARLDGDRVPLVYWLFRRPLAVMRSWAGL